MNTTAGLPTVSATFLLNDMKPRAEYNSEAMLAALDAWKRNKEPKWGDLKTCAYRHGVNPGAFAKRVMRDGLSTYYGEKLKTIISP